ncbi:MAG: hypothetical protein L3J05_00220 [Robiginitomaculum sp.]|nr:hypothetical protein [Robiginitomaculum sp.]
MVLLLLSALDTSDQNTRGAIFIPFSDMLVILLIPIAGTIIAAYLGLREIRKKNQQGFSDKGSFVWIALKAGFVAHWIIAFLMFLFLILIGGMNIFGTGIIISVKAIVFGVIYTFVLWGFLTLPISFIGGFLFWFVAVRGSENLMAEVFD